MDLIFVLIALSIGLFAGLCSGAFGIGGGIISIPLARCILGVQGLIVVGTSLPAVIPTALSGAFVYHRRRFILYKAAGICALTASGMNFVGAWCTSYFTGTQLMFIISVLIFFVGLKFLRSKKPNYKSKSVVRQELSFRSIAIILSIGGVAGFVSGFMGIGGGIIMVPMLVLLLKISIKQAIGTSLVVISIQAIPGSLEHWLLGHVDLMLMLMIIIGSVLAAQVGARLATKAKERNLRLLFVLFLFGLALYLGIAELLGLNP